MKKCPYCAEEIQDEAIVCKHCGRDLKNPDYISPSSKLWADNKNNNPETVTKTKKQRVWFYKNPWFWVLVVIVVIVIIVVNNSSSQVASQSDVASACSSFAPASVQTIDYGQLSKDPDSFKSTSATFTGQVLQIQESNGSGYLRLAVDKDSFGWNVSDVVLVDYSGHTDAVENDVVRVNGIMQGSQTYTSEANFQITIPLMYACSISKATITAK